MILVGKNNEFAIEMTGALVEKTSELDYEEFQEYEILVNNIPIASFKDKHSMDIIFKYIINKLSNKNTTVILMDNVIDD